MNVQFPRNLVPISKFPSIVILVGNCYFSTGRRATGRSPIVRKLETQRKLGPGLDGGVRLPSRTPAETPHSQPREALGAGEWLIGNARAFGFLSVSPQEARKIVDQFKKFDIRVRSVRDFCQEHNIEPLVLTQIAITLMTTPIQANRKTARELLLAASDIEDPAATLMLVKSALTRDSLTPLSDLSKPLNHLRRLVDSGNAPALFLQAQVCELEGKLKLALEMFLQSTTAANEKSTEAELVDIRLADAWRAVSRVRKRLGDNQGAKAALEIAALEYDDALAYLHLAKDFSDSTSYEHELYLLEAASSGILEAIEKLGLHYKDKLQNTLRDLLPGSQIGRVENSQAFEWLSIGAEAGNPLSQIHFAALLKNIHRSNEAFKWLAEASKSPQHAILVSRLKKMWK